MSPSESSTKKETSTKKQTLTKKTGDEAGGFAPMHSGLLEFATLLIIESAKPALYAGEIASILNRTIFSAKAGTVYPLLARLRRQGFVRQEYEESDVGPPRKYYYLTASGAERLDQIKNHWRKIELSLSSIPTRVSRFKMRD